MHISIVLCLHISDIKHMCFTFESETESIGKEEDGDEEEEEGNVRMRV